MRNKITIDELSVKSFVTALKSPADQQIKGGGRTLRNNVSDCCTYHPRYC